MPRKKQKVEERTKKRSVVFSTKQFEEIEKLAVKQNCFASDVIRDFVDKGLSVQGYKDDISFLTDIIRQVVGAEMGKQANRLAAMMYKIGVLSASNYFMNVQMLSDVINPSMQDDFKSIQERTRRLGMDYMNMKVKDVLEFLEDEEEIADTLAKIKRNWFDDDDPFRNRTD
jgi:spore coat polysaccharide biosynthesis protein SpsF (cytidylyltransferase family)